MVEVSYIPTWIHRFHRDGKRDFRVIPLLPDEEYWQQIIEDPYVTAVTLQ